MPVGDFAKSFASALLELGIPLEENVTVAWLGGGGHHHHGAASVPSAVRTLLSQIYAAVGGREELLQVKRSSRCGMDFRLDASTFVEVDEVQHFSTRRMTTLSFYDGFNHSINLDLYRSLCHEFSPLADRAWAKPVRNEFDFYGGRTSQRAYLDAVRDVLGPVFGVRIIRVAAPEGDLDLAVNRFQEALRDPAT